jgi:hypothetical protein
MDQEWHFKLMTGRLACFNITRGYFMWKLIKYKTKELNKKNLIKNVNYSHRVHSIKHSNFLPWLIKNELYL